ncbi:hypothetical protein ACK35E_11470 [Aeromonas veronii]
MKDLVGFFNAVDLSSENKEAVQQILSRLDQEVVSKWVSGIEAKDGKITGTFYTDIGAVLPFNQFIALYTALGYDPITIQWWRDYRCGHGGCLYNPGYTCNPNSCT